METVQKQALTIALDDLGSKTSLGRDGRSGPMYNSVQAHCGCRGPEDLFFYWGCVRQDSAAFNGTAFHVGLKMPQITFNDSRN